MFVNIFWPILLLSVQWKINAGDVKCNISRNTLVYKYDCRPRTNQQITLTVISPNSISVKCSGIYQAEDMTLPDISLGKHIADLTFYHCPIPKYGFEEVFKTFHFEILDIFSFYENTSNDSLEMQHFQRLTTVRRLSLQRCKITHLNGNIFKQITLLKMLNLDENYLILYDGLFNYASQLESLYLSKNRIAYLPGKVFENLKMLSILDLRHNKIRFINRKVFSYLINLNDLMLEYNSLIEIDIKAFEYQNNLGSIEIENNHLNYIARNLFVNCTKLVKIGMGKNNNLVLENRFLSELLYLNLVSLDNSGIQSLPEDIFSGSINLLTIDLQGNKIKFLPKKIFKNLHSLHELFLNDNKIEELDDEIFESLENLKTLKLHHNFLTILSKDLLKSLNNLKTLNLSFNQIHTIHSDALLKKRSLTHFLINNNRLDRVDFSSRNMVDCKHIKVLDFSNNRISLFPYTLIDGLVGNAKYEINTTLLQQTTTSVGVAVFLKNNKISQIRMNQSDLNSSDSLVAYQIKAIVAGNPIDCDCQSLGLVMESRKTQNSTRGVIFDYNNLFCNNPPHLKNVAVREVDVNELKCSLKNKCTSNVECDCNYKSVTRTIIIDCSHRNLSSFPHLVLDGLSEHFKFVNFSKVDLLMEDNLLEQGPTMNELNSNVTGLYLQRNIIKYMTWIPPNIEILNLDQNELESLDSSLINLLKESNLKSLSISTNPWRCNCEVKVFINYMWENIPKINNASQIRCNREEKALIYLKEEDICQFQAALTSIICSAVLICFIICSAAILMFYIYEKEILIWLYARGSCLWLIKEERLDKNKKYDAFVSFAHQDEKFVMDRLLPILELGVPPYKFCVHVRDWIPGEYIATQISNSVRDSKRTLIVLSPNFLKSVWGRMEFKTAHTSAMKEGRVRIILIIYGEVDMDHLDEELKAYIKTNTYIEWGDPWFWEKLRYALPKTRQMKKNPKRRRSEQNGIELH